ncbi:MAG TPA: metallophosphoesterase [Chitinophagaceae bacterium]|nr:metallophosphoesterase [Chitinophagaceae bacterium]
MNDFAAISLIIGIWIPALIVNKDGGSANGYDQLFKEKTSKRDTIKITVPNKDKDFFYVELKDSLKVERSTYENASEIIVISDIEGNFNGLYSFLISNKVMDKNYNWIFGNGHVVFLGDFVDRGTQSIQVLWLIYKLEQEAMKQDGKVHYILGNHEILNIQGAGYTDNIYIKNDQYSTTVTPFDESHKILHSTKTELGKWLRTKNSIEKIGNYIFVHGGISPKILSFKPDLDKINNTIRENIEDDLYNNPERNKLANFLIGREGPLWFRGLAIKYKYYNKVSQSEFKQIQVYFNSPKIVIGHTPVNDIQTDFDGALVKTDVAHGQEKFSGKTKGLLIENDIEYKIDDNGNKSKL